MGGLVAGDRCVADGVRPDAGDVEPELVGDGRPCGRQVVGASRTHCRRRRVPDPQPRARAGRRGRRRRSLGARGRRARGRSARRDRGRSGRAVGRGGWGGRVFMTVFLVMSLDGRGQFSSARARDGVGSVAEVHDGDRAWRQRDALERHGAVQCVMSVEAVARPDDEQVGADGRGGHGRCGARCPETPARRCRVPRRAGPPLGRPTSPRRSTRRCRPRRRRSGRARAPFRRRRSRRPDSRVTHASSAHGSDSHAP